MGILKYLILCFLKVKMSKNSLFESQNPQCSSVVNCKSLLLSVELGVEPPYSDPSLLRESWLGRGQKICAPAARNQSISPLLHQCKFNFSCACGAQKQVISSSLHQCKSKIFRACGAKKQQKNKCISHCGIFGPHTLLI